MRGVLVWHQRRRVDGNFANLRHVVLLVRPHLVGGRVLLVHDPDALELPLLNLEC